MAVSQFKVSEAAVLLGVSDDTLRRWAESGRIEFAKSESGRLVIDGVALANLAQELAKEAALQLPGTKSSARNRLQGIVTRVVKDTVMAQVELQAGPFRMVSLMSREAADDLGLEVGTLAVASVKATTVVIELEEHVS